MKDSPIFEILTECIKKCVAIITEEEKEEITDDGYYVAIAERENKEIYQYNIKFYRFKVDRCDNECQKN